MKLIVNADDFGMNENCSRAIAECFRKGWITNTTAMVNMPYSEQAAVLAAHDGLLDNIGLHLNFSQGIPLTSEIRELKEFCNDSGEFNRAFRNGVIRTWTPLRANVVRAVREEAEAQVKRYFDLGYRVKHFDSHHHSHLVIRILPILCDVLRMSGFACIRCPENLKSRLSIKSKVYYSIQETFQRKIIGSRGFVYTDYMGAYADLILRKDILQAPVSVELMVHPMYIKDNVLDLSGEMSDSGLRPMRVVSDYLEANIGQIERISFRRFLTETIR